MPVLACAKGIILLLEGARVALQGHLNLQFRRDGVVARCDSKYEYGVGAGVNPTLDHLHHERGQ